MRLSQLMVKSQAIQYQMLSQLACQAEPHEVKQLASQLKISLATCEKYLAQINDLARNEQVPLILNRRADQVRLVMGPELGWQAISQLMVVESTYFQILDYLFKQGQFTNGWLADSLAISEATLNRKISELNQILADFNLQVKNGQLKGSKHQVAYFYYQLYSLLLGPDERDELVKNYQIRDYLPYFEAINKGPFKPQAAYDLLLWLYVHQQVSYQDLGQDHSLWPDKIMNHYQNQAIYQRIRHHLIHYYGRQAGPINEADIFCHFVWLLSHGVLSHASHLQILGFGGPITAATNLTIHALSSQGLGQSRLREVVMYQTSQIYAQRIFFTGAVVDDFAISQAKASAYVKSENQIDSLLRQVDKQIYKDNVLGQGDMDLANSMALARLVQYIRLPKPSQIKIGLVLSADRPQVDLVLARLKQATANSPEVTISLYDDQEDYDYLLVGPNQTYQSDQTYYRMKGWACQLDLDHLMAYLEQVASSI
ncbi:hypothetical protein AWM75_02240 [Aerococcus urinaehominis]|uniref:Uncharacterized protein n=1 Tax=Aerococcus urinaehominis TaxID=128944 RepID=A0A0X8FKB4_9LACT|nr:helix-turn-helix domain-containing protein [Aerococcus urinaehominis]AMB98882.1 hypothetical protein AWM75_02240 [Aerococcus urinaehominis]SDM16120.1 Mga helix-turn-helix domain-containing protein [Aerococcus urinaehominis]